MTGMAGICSLEPLDGGRTDILLTEMSQEITYRADDRVDRWHDDHLAIARIHHGVVHPEAQPVFNEDGSLWAVLEGEVFGYDLDKKALMQAGHRFRLPGSDAEYIRARRYPAPPGVPFQKATEIEGTFWNTGLFKPEVPYEITVVSEGASLMFVVRGDGREARFEWNVSAFPLLSEGRIGLRLMPTRATRIRSFRVSVSAEK